VAVSINLPVLRAPAPKQVRHAEGARQLGGETHNWHADCRVIGMNSRLLERFLHTRYGFVTAIGGAMLLMLMNEGAYQHSHERLASGIALTDARIQAAQTLQWLTDAEMAVRGHVLTGDRLQLAPYRQALVQLPAVRDRAFALMRSVNPDQELTVARLQRLLDDRLAALAVVVELTEREPTLALAASTADARHQATAALRQAFTELLDRAATLQQGARDSLYGAMSLSRWTVHLLTLLTVCGIFIHTRHLHAADKLRQHAQEQLSGQVDERTLELRQLAGHLVTAREDERGRLARDLHDELGGLFTAMKLQIIRLRRQSQGSEILLTGLRAVEDRLNDGIAFKRRVIENLRPSALEHFGLISSLGLLCRDASQSMGIPVHEDLALAAHGTPSGLTPEGELTVYRLVQESLTNIAKYAAAQQVRVTVRQHEGVIQVRVEDDGHGFDPQRVPVGHHGLLGMRYRVESAGGTMRVLSTPGQGTCIEATLQPTGGRSDPPARAPGAKAALMPLELFAPSRSRPGGGGVSR